MAFYECVISTRQSLSATQVETLVGECKKILDDHGGKVSKVEYWGLKPLAYPIQKNRKAHFSLLNVTAPYEAVAELQRQIRLNEDVLRCLLTKVKTLDEEPSVMMNTKGDRGSYGGRPRRQEGGRPHHRSGEDRTRTHRDDREDDHRDHQRNDKGDDE